MTRTHTYTFAVLEVSQAAYDEIRKKLEEADYKHALVDTGQGENGIVIDMHGIALSRMPDTMTPEQKKNLANFIDKVI